MSKNGLIYIKSNQIFTEKHIEILKNKKKNQNNFTSRKRII